MKGTCTCMYRARERDTRLYRSARKCGASLTRSLRPYQCDGRTRPSHQTLRITGNDTLQNKSPQNKRILMNFEGNICQTVGVPSLSTLRCMTTTVVGASVACLRSASTMTIYVHIVL